jgi:hypothetical protein
MLRQAKHSNPAASAAVSDLFGDKPPVDSLSTIDGCFGAAVWLFSAIEKRHGTAQAERIFRTLGAPSPGHRRKLRDNMLLTMYDILKGQNPRWTVHRCAREIAARNARLPREDRLGPSGSKSGDTIRVHLHLLIKQRDGIL